MNRARALILSWRNSSRASRPADGVELGLVEEMLSAFWRQRRAWAIETRIMDTAISREPADHDELTRLADAFTAVAAQPQLELMHRYETRLHRIFQRALSNLIRMRALKVPPPEKTTLPNEPSPISEPLPAPQTEASEAASPRLVFAAVRLNEGAAGVCCAHP